MEHLARAIVLTVLLVGCGDVTRPGAPQDPDAQRDVPDARREAPDAAAALACTDAAECTTPGPCQLADGATCDGGACVYLPVLCDTPPPRECVDGDGTLRVYEPGACSVDSGACVYEFTDTPCAGCSFNCLGVCTDNADCDDGNPCTADVCAVDGSCLHPAADGGACGGGNCGVCAAGACVASEAACTGNCDVCAGSGTTFNCVPVNLCTGCGACVGGGTDFNCEGPPPTTDSCPNNTFCECADTNCTCVQ